MRKSMRFVGVLLLALGTTAATCGEDGNNGASNNGASNNGASNNGSTTNNGASNNGASNNGANSGGGEIVAWEGENTCVGGGGDEMVGTYRVTVDGESVGPFSVWGVGAEPSTYTLVGCSGVGGCAQGICWADIGVNIVFANFQLGENPIVGDRIVGMDANVDYADTTGDTDVKERAQSGTITVTSWDFPTQQFTGTVDVETESGRSIQVEFDVDGTDF